MHKYNYDAVVVGAGSGGLTTAVGLTRVGKKVLLVEKEHLGGECTNTGCIPSKALIHAAKEFSKHLSDSHEKATTALTYTQSIIDKFLAEETPENFATLGIEVKMGEAIFTNPHTILIEDKKYTFKYAVIATGSSPRLIDIPGLNPEDLLTNQNFFDLNEIPDKTLIIGSGPIGLELGEALAMLGSQVTIASIDKEIGRLEDTAIRPLLHNSLLKLGIDIKLNAFIKRVDGKLAVFDIKKDGQVESELRIKFDKILLAVGRVPNLPRGLEQANIKYDKHAILVDDQYRTTNCHIYALGDVSQRLKFTHTADDAAREVVKHIASFGLLRAKRNKSVPKVTYTTPEIAQVGLSWPEAVHEYTEERLLRIEIPLGNLDRAITDDAADGILVVIARRLSGTILGAHLMSPRAGEIISIFSLAIDEGISLWRLQKIVFAYPTYAQLVKKAGDAFLATQLTNLRFDLSHLFKRAAPKLLAAIFWSTILITFYHYQASRGLTYQQMLSGLFNFFTHNPWGPVLYMVLYAIRPLVFFPATLLTALSGALFGFWWGLLYTFLGENASANFAYWIGRFFGREWRLEDSPIGRWVKALRDNSFESVLLMRLFYVPFDLTNYGSGVLRVRWIEYFFATVIGIIPGMTTFVALGAALDIESFKMNGLTFDALDPKYIAVSVTVFIVSLLLSRHLKKWRAIN